MKRVFVSVLFSIISYMPAYAQDYNFLSLEEKENIVHATINNLTFVAKSEFDYLLQKEEIKVIANSVTSEGIPFSVIQRGSELAILVDDDVVLRMQQGTERQLSSSDNPDAAESEAAHDRLAAERQGKIDANRTWDENKVNEECRETWGTISAVAGAAAAVGGGAPAQTVSAAAALIAAVGCKGDWRERNHGGGRGNRE